MAITTENVYMRICQQNPAVNPPDLYCEWSYVPNPTRGTPLDSSFELISQPDMEALIAIALLYWSMHFIFKQIKKMIEM